MKNFMKGEHYRATGESEFHVSIEDYHTAKISSSRIRLNQNHKKWTLHFNEIELQNIHNPSKKYTLYLTIHLGKNPEPGTYNTFFLYGPKFEIDLFSPDRFSDGSEIIIKRSRFYSGTVHLTQFQLTENGMISGDFIFERKTETIKGKFHAELKKSSFNFGMFK